MTRIAEGVENVSRNLEVIESLLRQEGDRKLKIRIPNGVVRKERELSQQYSFVCNRTIKKNICYAVEALDFIRWIVNRCEVYGPVAGYLYKMGIILSYMIVESMLYDFLFSKGKSPSKYKFQKNICKFNIGWGQHSQVKLICESMKKLHDRRANIHLFLVTDLEATKYTLRDWNLAIICLQNVRNVLSCVN